jgi:UDP-N-acetylglucosamine 4,6-dehydratase
MKLYLDKDKKYLITGGSGFLGQALIKRMTDEGFEDIVVLSKDEDNLLTLQDKFPNIRIIVGDISNVNNCDKACNGVHGIFHLAAFKHVGLAETNAKECMNSNVIGSMNLLECTLKHNIEFIIGISTDKATRMKGVYGVSKWMMEKLFEDFQSFNKKTAYRIVRYGNVLYSTGSVLCKWKEKLIKGEEILVTDMDSTRFYWTVDEAIGLIFDCLKWAEDAKPFSKPMKSIRMKELLEAMTDKYANQLPKIKIIGLQEGENMHEQITDDGLDSSQAEKYTKEEIMELI